MVHMDLCGKQVMKNKSSHTFAVLTIMPHWTNAVITIVHICAVSMGTRIVFAFIYFSFTISSSVTRVTLTRVVVDIFRAVSMDTRH